MPVVYLALEKMQNQEQRLALDLTSNCLHHWSVYVSHSMPVVYLAVMKNYLLIALMP